MTDKDVRGVGGGAGEATDSDFELEGSSEHQQIREIFALMPQAGTREVAEECIKRELWDVDQLYGFQVSHGMARVRKALAILNEHNVPFACPIEAGAEPKWKQTELFTFEDFVFVISQRVSGIEADMKAVVGLRNRCMEIFGKVPELPDLDWLETE